MNIQKRKVTMFSQKVIANVSPELAKAYQLPEGHQNIAFFSVDNDDVAYLALDDASKKANIKVIRCETFYAGMKGSWARDGGSVFAMFSGPKVADVKSGLRYVKDFIDHNSALCDFDGDEGTSFYAQMIPRAGKYFQEKFDVPEGNAYAYLVGGPIETHYALDKALKAGDTKITCFWYPPSHANSAGAILTGTESACRAATTAFIDSLAYALEHPMDF